MSRKLRLVPGLVAKEHCWERRVLGHIVVVLDSRANRSTVARHQATFAATFPSRTADVRRWLRSPTADLAGLWFLALRREAHPEGSHLRRIRSAHAQAPVQG
jgi:hypothetical protein